MVLLAECTEITRFTNIVNFTINCFKLGTYSLRVPGSSVGKIIIIIIIIIQI